MALCEDIGITLDLPKLFKTQKENRLALLKTFRDERNAWLAAHMGKAGDLPKKAAAQASTSSKVTVTSSRTMSSSVS